MEEAKPAENAAAPAAATHAAADPPPFAAAESQPPAPAPALAPASATPSPPPPPPPTNLPPKISKKRQLDGSSFQIQNSKYFKMRAVLRDLRPYFVELLRTPDFRGCKAAEEIQEKMKLMVELYQQMTGETAKYENAPKNQSSLPNGNGINQEQRQNVKPTEQPQTERYGVKSSETWSFQMGPVADKQQPEGVEKAGSYIVGGSAFGWNFITFGGSEPVYYGVTKESFRSSYPISEEVKSNEL